MDTQAIQLRIDYPDVDRAGRKSNTYRRTGDFTENMRYVDSAGQPTIEVNYRSVAERLSRVGVKSTWGDISIRIQYPVG
jgi:hypothetical protein